MRRAGRGRRPPGSGALADAGDGAAALRHVVLRGPDACGAAGPRETSETEAEGWGRPRDILAAGEAGTLRLMPPTIVNLEQLAGFASVEEFLADVPPLDQVEPVVVETADGYVMETTLP